MPKAGQTMGEKNYSGSWLCHHPGKPSRTQLCARSVPVTDSPGARHQHRGVLGRYGVLEVRDCEEGLKAARVLAWAEVRASSGASCEWGCCFAGSGVEEAPANSGEVWRSRSARYKGFR